MAWLSSLGADGMLSGGGMELVPLSVALINSGLSAAFALPGFGDSGPRGTTPANCGSGGGPLARSLHSTNTSAGAGLAHAQQQPAEPTPGPTTTVARPQDLMQHAPSSARRKQQQARRRAQQRQEQQRQLAASSDPADEDAPRAADDDPAPTSAPEPTSVTEQPQQVRQLSQWSQGALELSSEAWGPPPLNAPTTAVRTPSTTSALGRASAQGGGGMLSGAQQQNSTVLLPPPLFSEPGVSSATLQQAATSGGANSQQQHGGPAPAAAQQQQQLMAFLAYQQLQHALAAQQQQPGANVHLLQLQAAAAAAAAVAATGQPPPTSGGTVFPPLSGFPPPPPSSAPLVMGPYGVPDYAAMAQMLGGASGGTGGAPGPLGAPVPATSSLSLSTLSQPAMSQGQAAELGTMDPAVMHQLMLMQQQQQQMQAIMMQQSQSQEDLAGGGRAKAIKRPRLVWTPQLHKRFEEAVQKLGDNKAVPKNIMQEMNVEGLTRENVASHLQKYRLQRGQGMGGMMPTALGVGAMSCGVPAGDGATSAITAGQQPAQPQPATSQSQGVPDRHPTASSSDR